MWSRIVQTLDTTCRPAAEQLATDNLALTTSTKIQQNTVDTGTTLYVYMISDTPMNWTLLSKKSDMDSSLMGQGMRNVSQLIYRYDYWQMLRLAKSTDLTLTDFISSLALALQ